MKKKLIVKVVAIIVLFSMILFVFLLLNSLSVRKKLLIPVFIGRAEAITNSIESSIISEKEINDKDRLMSTIQKNIWLNPDIISVSINILEGDKLVPYISNKQGTAVDVLDQENFNSLEHDVFISQTRRAGDIEILESTTPIHISGKVVGTIQVVFDLSDINRQMAEALRYEVIYHSALILLFIIVLALVFQFAVVRRILEINKGVKAITASNFDYKIKVRSKDEIGDLARAFNTMTGELKESQDKLNKYNETLKKQVIEKTKVLEQAKEELKNINVDLEGKIRERTAKLEELRVNQEKIIEQRTTELTQKLAELEKMNNIMVNREIKMIELKKEIEKLKGVNTADKETLADGGPAV